MSVNVSGDTKSCTGKDDDYRGNLAGFIVQGLLILLFFLTGLLTAIYMIKTGGIYRGEEENTFMSAFYGSLHSKWGTEDKYKAANVYLLVGVLSSFTSIIYFAMAMALKSTYWHCCAYAMNVPMWTSLAMMAYSWYFCPLVDNGIGWVWTVLLVLSLGLEAILCMVRFVDPKHAYILPWIKKEAVPDMVI